MQEPNDILKPLPFEKWPLLKNSLKRDWLHFAYYYYWVDNAIRWKIKVKVPEDMKIEFLRDSDVSLVHDLWLPLEVTKNREKSSNYISTLVRLNQGIELIRKRDDNLMSWALHSNWGGLGVVQTVDEFRGKGFAKIRVNALAEHLANEDLDVTLFVAKGNVASEKLFASLNFQRVNSETFIFIEPLINDC